jgi:3-hydroxyisobutyrate dehydrogenase-like beta-hydroxyacid dehydrogenase
MSTPARLGFVGLGIMGAPICRNIAQNTACTMAAYDLDPASVERLGDYGVTAAASLAELARAADIIFLSLPGGREVEQVIAGKDGLLAHGADGQIVVDMSTCPVDTARRMAAELTARRRHFADAPVARTRQAAEDGTLSIMVGCTDDVLPKIRPYLAAAAADVTHCGGVGAGQCVKLMNNMVLFQTVIALAEALAIAERSGVAPDRLAETLAKGSADSFALRNHGLKSMVPGIYPEDAFATDYALKDIEYALELAADCGIEASGAELARAILERSSKAGHGAAYFPALRKLIAETG